MAFLAASQSLSSSLQVVVVGDIGLAGSGYIDVTVGVSYSVVPQLSTLSFHLELSKSLQPVKK